MAPFKLERIGSLYVSAEVYQVCIFIVSLSHFSMGLKMQYQVSHSQVDPIDPGRRSPLEEKLVDQRLNFRKWFLEESANPSVIDG